MKLHISLFLTLICYVLSSKIYSQAGVKKDWANSIQDGNKNDGRVKRSENLSKDNEFLLDMKYQVHQTYEIISSIYTTELKLLEDKTNENIALRKQMQTLEADNAKLKEDNARLRGEIKHSQTLEYIVESFNKEIAGCHEKNAKCQVVLKQTEKLLDIRSKDITNLNATLEELEKKITESYVKEINNLLELKHSQQLQIKLLQEELAVANETKAQNMRLNDCVRESANLKTANDQLSIELTGSQSQVNNLNRENNELKHRNAKATENVSNCKTEIAAKNAELQTLSAANSNFQYEIQQKNNLFASCEREGTKCRKELTDCMKSDQTVRESKVGAKVIRGPDWIYGKQDFDTKGIHIGTIIKDAGNNRVDVKWANGNIYRYNIGAANKFDLAYAQKQ